MPQRSGIHRDVKQAFLTCLAILMPLLSTIFTVTASVPSQVKNPFLTDKQIVSDEELREIAVKNGIIPAETDKAYIDEQCAQKNTVPLWIITNREQKIQGMDKLKEMFRKDGAILKLSAEYYVDELNGVLYSSIEKGDITDMETKGTGMMIKTIAIMDGDYDNGTSRVELARKQLGEEMFGVFKMMYPEKYQNLIKLDGTK